MLPNYFAEATVLQRVSFGILIAFLFMIFSRIFDVQLAWLHIPGISYRVMAVFLVMSGTFLAAFREAIGKFIIAFTACFLAAIPFSVWKSGSFHALTEQWLVGFVVFMATAALISDFRQYIRTAKTVALAILVLTVICITLGTVVNGRLFLPRGRFANPNEMAQALLLGMPFWWAITSSARSHLLKVFGAASIGLMLYVISKTGSRGALVCLALVMGVIFLRASVVGKVKVLAAVMVMLLVGVLMIPQALRARYQTFFRADIPEAWDQVDANFLNSAVGSTNNRKEMLIRSLQLTVTHPFLGVGPGMFVVAEDTMAKSEGERMGSWLGTHNSFTQVSSECGIPALLFYVAIVGISFKRSYALHRRARSRPEWREISIHALALNYSLIVFIITGFFVHAAYTALLPVLAGLTVSLVRTADPLLAQQEPEDAPPQPVRARAAAAAV
ncbi:MAG: hypothetical protein C5B51_27570 [Terriglobia bacterium]|nr:MAG: hypothetical protein C5B51_27570 [Terriglobia bacterium]